MKIRRSNPRRSRGGQSRLVLLLAAALSMFGCTSTGSVATIDGPHQISVMTGSYAGDWYIGDEDEPTNGDRIVRLAAGDYELRIASFFYVPFSVDAEGRVEVPAEYEIAAVGGMQELMINSSHVDFAIGNLSLDWKIHGVREPGFNDDTHDPIHSFLVRSDTYNSAGGIGASYRMSFADDGSAIHIDVSTNEVSFRDGINAKATGLEYVGGEIRFLTKAITVEDLNETETEWTFQEYDETLGSVETVYLLPDMPFYFLSEGRRVAVEVTEQCQVIPHRIVAGDADFRLSCLINGDDPIPDSINNSLPLNCSTTLGAAATEPPAFGQTIRIGRDGFIARIDFGALKFGDYEAGPLRLELRDVTEIEYRGARYIVPGSTVIGTVEIAEDDIPELGYGDPLNLVMFDFAAQQIIVEKGQRYGLVLTRNETADHDTGKVVTYCSMASEEAPNGYYEEGQGFWLESHPDQWRPFGRNNSVDFRFRVIVADL